MKRCICVLLVLCLLTGSTVFSRSDPDFFLLSNDITVLPGINDEDMEDPVPGSEPGRGISDDYFSVSQYSFHNTGSYKHYSPEGFSDISSEPDMDLDVPEGWSRYNEIRTTHNSVIVAVIDTGVDYLHPDLAANMWTNVGEISGNGVDDDENGYIDDVYGWDFYNDDNTVCHYAEDPTDGSIRSLPSDCDDHGTHVAGIIGAVKDNGIGISGLASVGNIRIMSLKIHGGSRRRGKLSDAIRAIKYAESMGASICNISWGTYTYSPSLAQAIKHSKMLFICAAGNDGTDNDERPIYPACLGYDNVISVGFVNASGMLTYNPNYGISSVDIAVPSTDIISTIVGGYGSISGSSMAAPHVTAIAALLYSLKDTYASAAKNIILDSVKKTDGLGSFIRYGGIPSLDAALSLCDTLPVDNDPPAVAIAVGYDHNGIRLSFDVSDDDSGVCSIHYLPGRHYAEDFDNGTTGPLVEDGLLYLSKSGIYTFFIQDKAGNYTIRTLPVLDDLVRPFISDTTLILSDNDPGLIISTRVSDKHSGIRSVRYLKGKHTVSDFKNASVGEKLEPDENGIVQFAADAPGTYTIYVADNRGNRTVSTIMAYFRPLMYQKNPD